MVAEADHLVTIHVAAGRVNQDWAGTALAHRAVPERDDTCGMVHRHVPDVGSQVLQVLADHVFGRGGGESLAETYADDSVEILRAVHTFGGVSVSAGINEIRIF